MKARWLQVLFASAPLVALAGLREALPAHAEPLGMALALYALVLAGALALHALRTPARRLAEAEAQWERGTPASQVRYLLSAPLLRVGGETGYRTGLLEARMDFSLGYRDRAWGNYLEAHLLRLPIPQRLLARPFFRRVPETPPPAKLRWGRFLLRLCPHLPHLHHRQGLLHLRLKEREQAWAHFRSALPLAVEDPLLLEDLLLAALDQPDLGDVADRALDLLRSHHGDPRLPWDRASGARFLVNQGRFAEAVALILPLAPEQRTHPWHWAGLAIALRRLGDEAAAWKAVESGLRQHPGSFRLWMERFHLAMDRSADQAALESLEGARRHLPEGPEAEALQHEWQLRKAEFEYWARGDAEAAMAALDRVPLERQTGHHPPLRLQLLNSLGDYEATYRELQPLLAQHPDDLELLLLQADAMAGLEAWKALLPFLDQLPTETRSRPLFWHLRGLSLIHLGDAAQSRQDLERAAHMEPGNLRFVLDAGHACAELGEWERSETHWRQALRLDRSNEEALVQLSEARRYLHDESGARRYLRECLTHHPDSEEAQTRLAELEAQ